MSVLATVLLVFLWWVSSGYFNLSAKLCLAAGVDPLVVTFWTMAGGAALSFVLLSTRVSELSRLSPAKTCALVLLHAVANAATTFALSGSSVELVHTLKALEPFFSAVLVWFTGAGAKLSLGMAVGIVTVAASSVLTAYGEATSVFLARGVGAAMVSNVAFATRNVLMKGMQDAEPELAPLLQFVMYAGSALVLAPAMVFSGAIEQPTLVSHVGALLGCATVLHFLYTTFSLAVLQHLDALSHAVVNVLKRVVVVLLAGFSLGSLSVRSTVGISVASVGVGIFSISRALQHRHHKKAADGPRVLSPFRAAVLTLLLVGVVSLMTSIKKTGAAADERHHASTTPSSSTSTSSTFTSTSTSTTAAGGTRLPDDPLGAEAMVRLWERTCSSGGGGSHRARPLNASSKFDKCAFNLKPWSQLTKRSLRGYHMSWVPRNNSGDELVTHVWHLLVADAIREMKHVPVSTSYLETPDQVTRSEKCGFDFEAGVYHFFVWGGGSLLDWVMDDYWWKELQAVRGDKPSIYLNSPGTQQPQNFRSETMSTRIGSVLNGSFAAGGVRGFLTREAAVGPYASMLQSLPVIGDVGLLASKYYGVDNAEAWVSSRLGAELLNPAYPLLVFDSFGLWRAPVNRQVYAEELGKVLRTHTIVLVAMSDFAQHRLTAEVVFEFCKAHINNTELTSRLFMRQLHSRESIPDLVALLKVAKAAVVAKLHAGVIAVSVGTPFLYLQHPYRDNVKSDKDKRFWKSPEARREGSKFLDFLSVIQLPPYLPWMTWPGDIARNLDVLLRHREVYTAAFREVTARVADFHAHEARRFLLHLAGAHPAEFRDVFCSKHVAVQNVVFAERSLVMLSPGD